MERSCALLIVVMVSCDSRAPAAPPTKAAPVAAAASPGPVAAPAPPTGTPADPALVEYATGRKGFFYRPQGAGPFPVVVWNHGSDKLPGWQPELAHFYVEHGWAFLLPHRRGHGRSPGPYIVDEHDLAKQVALQDEHSADVVAAIAWVKQQPAIDPSRVVVSGCSFGGIQTMIVAAKDVGIRAAVAFAPGAMQWRVNPALQDRLTRAARDAKVPVFLLQADNDYDLSPSRVVGAELEKLGHDRHRVHIYPQYGFTPQDGHGGFCTRGFSVWGADVLAFLDHATAASR